MEYMSALSIGWMGVRIWKSPLPRGAFMLGFEVVVEGKLDSTLVRPLMRNAKVSYEGGMPEQRERQRVELQMARATPPGPWPPPCLVFVLRLPDRTGKPFGLAASHRSERVLRAKLLSCWVIA